MIWSPKPGQKVMCNYKNKSMCCQGVEGVVEFTSNGPGPRNVSSLAIDRNTGMKWHECIPRGNLVELKRVKP